MDNKGACLFNLFLNNVMFSLLFIPWNNIQDKNLWYIWQFTKMNIQSFIGAFCNNVIIYGTLCWTLAWHCLVLPCNISIMMSLSLYNITQQHNAYIFTTHMNAWQDTWTRDNNATIYACKALWPTAELPLHKITDELNMLF